MSEEVAPNPDNTKPSKKEFRKQKREARRSKKNQRQLLVVQEKCINCDSQLALDQLYCSECGGKRMYNRITARNLLEDFIDRFLNIENSFFKTFIALFTKPEDVIVGFMNGMRKKYLPAFNYFAIALTVNGIYNFILRKWLIDDLYNAQTSIYGVSDDPFQQEFAGVWMDTLLEYQSLVMFATIPFLAILARMVFWNYKKFNLTEHLVIQLYTYSHMSIVMVIVTILCSWSTLLLTVVSFVNFFWMFGYSAYVLKRVFELDLARLILKTLLFFGFFFFISIVGGIGYGIYIGKKLSEGTLEDSPFNNVVKESFEKARKEKKKQDSIQALQDSAKDQKTLVIDSLSN